MADKKADRKNRESATSLEEALNQANRDINEFWDEGGGDANQLIEMWTQREALEEMVDNPWMKKTSRSKKWLSNVETDDIVGKIARGEIQ